MKTSSSNNAVYGKSPSQAYLEKEANSFLIAAAPELLEALKFALKVLERDFDAFKDIMNGEQDRTPLQSKSLLSQARSIAEIIVKDYVLSPNGNPIEIARQAIAKAGGVK